MLRETITEGSTWVQTRLHDAGDFLNIKNFCNGALSTVLVQQDFGLE